MPKFPVLKTSLADNKSFTVTLVSTTSIPSSFNKEITRCLVIPLRNVLFHSGVIILSDLTINKFALPNSTIFSSPSRITTLSKPFCFASAKALEVLAYKQAALAKVGAIFG